MAKLGRTGDNVRIRMNFWGKIAILALGIVDFMVCLSYFILEGSWPVVMYGQKGGWTAKVQRLAEFQAGNFEVRFQPDVGIMRCCRVKIEEEIRGFPTVSIFDDLDGQRLPEKSFINVKGVKVAPLR